MNAKNTTDCNDPIILIFYVNAVDGKGSVFLNTQNMYSFGHTTEFLYSFDGVIVQS